MRITFNLHICTSCGCDNKLLPIETYIIHHSQRGSELKMYLYSTNDISILFDSIIRHNCIF